MSKAKTRRLSNSSQAALPTKAAPQYSIPHPDTMPDRYVVHCSGTCLEPDITDGAPVLVEKHGKIASGDLVVLFFKPEHAPAGKYPAILKRLVMAPPPYVSFPWREHPQSDVHALIIVEMLNPHKQFAYKCEHLLGVHKCVGRVPAAMTLDVIGQTYQTYAGETISSDAENTSGEITDPSPVAPPARTSRRGFLMNSIVSSASLATVTAIAPSAALADTAVEISAARDKKEAVIARAQQIVKILGDRFVCDGWHEHFDQQRAAEFLDAVRREDLSGDDEQPQSVITSWIADHGQSLDWLYLGDPGGLICSAVAGSPVVATIPLRPDPIFAAIDRHKASVEAHMKAVHDKCRLEEVLPPERCQSSITIYERKIVQTDDPRWIEAEEQVDKVSDAMEDAATEILNFEPETLQGAFAVLRYAVDHMDRYDGEMMGWPDSLLRDGVDADMAKWNVGRSAEYFLMQNVAVSLERLLNAT